MLIDPADTDWTGCSDAKVYHSAADGIPQAVAELRRREAQHRVNRIDPAAKAAMASRIRNGRPAR